MLAPLLADFAAAHPDLTLDVTMTDRQIDLVEHDIDVAMRMAALADSSMVARRLASNRRMLCASPAYLSARGTPVVPDDLRAHDGLYFEGYGAGSGWLLERSGQRHVATPRVRLRATAVELILRFAVEGRGIAILPAFLADGEIDAGRLAILMGDHRLPPSAVHALTVSRRHVPAKTRRCIDYLAERLPAMMP